MRDHPRPAAKEAEGARSALRQNRFIFLLAGLLLLFVAAPLVRVSNIARYPWLPFVILTVVYAYLLLSAVYAACRRRRSLIFAGSLLALSVLLDAAYMAVERPAVEIAGHGVSILLLAYVIVLILRYVFERERVTFNTICASLCVYLLLGVLWSLTYSILERLEPGSFIMSSALEEKGDVMAFGAEKTVFTLYYSFVTLTTLGYGDITPATSAARMLAVVEAVMGQVYLVVLVAWLVGQHARQARQRSFRRRRPRSKKGQRFPRGKPNQERRR